MLLSFLAAVGALTLLTMLPGPDVAVVTRIALSRGRAAAFRTTLGIVTGLTLWGLLTVAGLTAILEASATAYTAVKLAGGAYLCWLGVRAILTAGREHEVPRRRDRSAFRTGFVSNVLNVKIAAFYTGVLPQLVPDGAPHAATLAALVAAHVAVTVAWLAIYAALVTRAAEALRRPRVRRALDRVTGVVLLGFGTRVATS